MSKVKKDILNECGHRNSERVEALKKFPFAGCPACLLERIKDLKANLIDYGIHKRSCAYTQGLRGSTIEKCDCGFDKALKGGEE